MTNDWALEELSPRGFEQLSAALAAKLLGPEIQVYGSGKDGGREATYTGTIDWPGIADEATGPRNRWTGYTVIQAKQRERVVSTAEGLSWLKGQIRSELDDWAVGKRSTIPRNLLFVTNVRLSAEETSGGVDQILRYIDAQVDKHRTDDEGRPAQTLRTRGLQNAFVWHRDTLNALVSDHAAIRDAFPALLTVGDLLTRLSGLPGVIQPEQLAPLLVAHAQSAIRHERWLRFDDAGDTPEGRYPIDDAIVDLPARHDGNRSHSVLNRVILRADQVTRPSVWGSPFPRHLVVTGAPGNGKSTVAQYITQVYRANFARREANEPGVVEVIKETDGSLGRIGVPVPKNPRWPLRVDLAEMAKAMGPVGGPNIKRWLSELVTEKSEVTIEPASLTRWIRAWPTLLVFDGFDEVTMPQLRQRVVDEIRSLMEWADTVDADLLMIITTRRTGYIERILPDDFDQIDLTDFTTHEAVNYARHITDQRLSDDIPQRNHVLARFSEAILNPAIVRLLKTPLQVLILTIILEGSGTLPTTRYQLFATYFETVLKRESNKDTTNRSFFRERRGAIIELHEIVGAILQTRCEATGDVVAKMPRSELAQLAAQYMRDAGHDEETAKMFADRIFTVATQRLVLLTADENDTVSFDVRSLQELMAGLRLVDGSDEVIRSNLRLTALSPHWRNTWLFAAGKLADDGQHRRNMLLDIVERCDTDSQWPAWLCPAAPELAAYLVDDGLAADRPNDQSRLVVVALRCLEGPLPQEPQAVASALESAAARNALVQQRIRNELRDAQASGRERQAIARILIHHGRYGGRIPGSYTNADLQRAVDMWNFQLPKIGHPIRTSVAALIRHSLDELAGAVSPDSAALVENAMEDLTDVILTRTENGDLWPVTDGHTGEASQLDAALDNSEAAELLQLCLGALDADDWAAKAVVARLIGAKRARKPVSQGLTTRVPMLHN